MVESAMWSVAGICVLVQRNRRSRSIWASTFGGVRVGRRCGADDRSNIDSPAS
jgi:hypothetical protein